jgi:hypothetical protein
MPLLIVFDNFSSETWNIYFGIIEAHYWTNGSLRAEYTVIKNLRKSTLKWSYEKEE